ncbi:MAG: hypothetical protein KDK72_07465 [Chlamydiia bacterium]|nr:hypothetical protein [Chlamydiia bacterium]
MKISNWLNVFISLLIFTSCNGTENHDKSDMMDEILAHHKKYIYNHYPWVLSMEGGGIPDKVTLFSIGFALVGPLDIHTARKYLIDATKNLEKSINDHKKIRSHLIEYPFPIQNIEYELVLFDENKKRVKQSGGMENPNNLSFILLNKGKIIYYVDNEKSNNHIPVHRETYEEAKRIVEIEL